MMRVGLSSALGLLLSLLTTGASSNTSLSARTETGAEETPVHIAISDGGVSSQTNAAGWERVRSLIRINSDQWKPSGVTTQDPRLTSQA